MYPVVGVVLYLLTQLAHLKDIQTWKALTENQTILNVLKRVIMIDNTPDVNWPSFLVGINV